MNVLGLISQFIGIETLRLTLSIVAGGWGSNNLIVYLITVYNVKSIMATKIYNIVPGCNSLFPVAGAIIADSFLGSFPVVTISAFVSLLVINLGYLFILI
jgi:peptide/histidine transporter 3/4